MFHILLRFMLRFTFIKSKKYFASSFLPWIAWPFSNLAPEYVPKNKILRSLKIVKIKNHSIKSHQKVWNPSVYLSIPGIMWISLTLFKICYETNRTSWCWTRLGSWSFRIAPLPTYQAAALLPQWTKIIYFGAKMFE